jgi:DNA-binding transcriptional MerR regulator
MEMKYKARHLRSVFDVSNETIRNWSKEFAKFLSPGANPSGKQHRAYTEEDLSVLTLVAEMRDDGHDFESIHMSLSNGSRGKLPERAPEEIEATSGTKAITLLQSKIVGLQQELVSAEERIGELEGIAKQKDQLEMELRFERSKTEDLSEQIQELQKEVRQLYEKVGREYAKGYVDAMSQSSDSDD